MSVRRPGKREVSDATSYVSGERERVQASTPHIGISGREKGGNSEETAHVDRPRHDGLASMHMWASKGSVFSNTPRIYRARQGVPATRPQARKGVSRNNPILYEREKAEYFGNRGDVDGKREIPRKTRFVWVGKWKEYTNHSTGTGKTFQQDVPCGPGRGRRWSAYHCWPVKCRLRWVYVSNNWSRVHAVVVAWSFICCNRNADRRTWQERRHWPQLFQTVDPAFLALLLYSCPTSALRPLE